MTPNARVPGYSLAKDAAAVPGLDPSGARDRTTAVYPLRPRSGCFELNAPEVRPSLADGKEAVTASAQAPEHASRCYGGLRAIQVSTIARTTSAHMTCAGTSVRTRHKKQLEALRLIDGVQT